MLAGLGFLLLLLLLMMLLLLLLLLLFSLLVVVVVTYVRFCGYHFCLPVCFLIKRSW